MRKSKARPSAAVQFLNSRKPVLHALSSVGETALIDDVCGAHGLPDRILARFDRDSTIH